MEKEINSNWHRPSSFMPNLNSRVEWMDSRGNVTKGTFTGVWMMDNGMYIYYVPTMWRYIDPE